MIALKELNIRFIHKASMPDSAELYEFSPFGTIPILVHVRPFTNAAPQLDLLVSRPGCAVRDSRHCSLP